MQWELRGIIVNQFRLLAISLLFLQSQIVLALSGGPIEGYVLDYDTGKPIAGVQVAVTWIGPLVQGSACVHVDAAVSDADGKYMTGSWSALPGALMFHTSPSMSAYKTGYQQTLSPLAIGSRVDGDDKPLTWFTYRRGAQHIKLGQFANKEDAIEATRPNNVYMTVLVQQDAKRYNHLWGLASGADCLSDDGSQRNVYPMLRDIFQEVKVVASSRKEREGIEPMRDTVARAWLARPSRSYSIADPASLLPEALQKELQ